MRVIVDQDKCIDLASDVEQAARVCPAAAIRIEN